jgi:hypothetical protein
MRQLKLKILYTVEWDKKIITKNGTVRACEEGIGAYFKALFQNLRKETDRNHTS